MRIIDVLTTAAEVKALPLEELSWLVLEYLKGTKDQKGMIQDKATFAQPANEYGTADVEVAQLFMEAWEFLEHQGLIVHLAGYTNGYSPTRYAVSRRGEVLSTKGLWEEYLRGYRLSEGLLHPEIVATSYAAYLRGDYDSAVRDGFLALENAMRPFHAKPAGKTGSELAGDMYGKGGPLRDETLGPGEAEGLCLCFRGAFMYWRNMLSHQVVNLEAAPAAQLLFTISNLFAQFDRDVARAKTAGKL